MVSARVDDREKGKTVCELHVNGISGSHQNKAISSITDKHGGGLLADGLPGRYSPVKNDFSGISIVTKGEKFSDESEQVSTGKLRFYVSFLALICLSILSMSKITLNVSVVDMLGSDRDPAVLTNDSVDSTSSTGLLSDVTASELAENESSGIEEPEVEHGPIKLQNAIISAYFFGYMPMLLVGGNLADKYGSKSLVLGAMSLTAIINILTPLMTRLSLPCLIASRVILGISQGPLVPAMYDLFNRWLTVTERSIVAPMIKVAFGLGGVFGSLVPGLAQMMGLTWRMSFYFTGFIAGTFALIWLFLVTSNPADNSRVGQLELQRIQRKKTADCKKSSETKTPWIAIVTNPSVIVLTLVKFTYNVGFDFFSLEIAIYLRNIHNAPMTTISSVTSAACFVHVLFITPVSWLAKELVKKKCFGLGKTTWRKIFQGSANFGMATAYLIMPLVADNVIVLFSLFAIVIVCYMFGAGGESLIPFDLSQRYPATIMGFAHSISILSGIAIPVVSSAVLGDSPHEQARWNTLFTIIGSALAFGGLAFVLVLKAKPFLPEEKKAINDIRGNLEAKSSS